MLALSNGNKLGKKEILMDIPLCVSVDFTKTAFFSWVEFIMKCAILSLKKTYT